MSTQGVDRSLSSALKVHIETTTEFSKQPHRPPNCMLRAGTPPVRITKAPLPHRGPTDILSVKVPWHSMHAQSNAISQTVPLSHSPQVPPLSYTLITSAPSPFISKYTTRQYIGALHMSMINQNTCMSKWVQELHMGEIASLTCLSDTLRVSYNYTTFNCQPLSSDLCTLMW